MVKLEEQSLYR